MAEGYGSDVSLTTKLVTGRLLTGKAVVIEALFRRLITPRGSLYYDLTFGFDASGLVGAVGYRRSAAVLGGMVENELAKDDRVINVRCEATLSTLDDGTLQLLLLDVDATLVETGEDLSFTASVTDVSTELLTAA